MIMYIKGIASAAYLGRTQSSARMLMLLRHLFIASQQQLSDTLHAETKMIRDHDRRSDDAGML